MAVHTVYIVVVVSFAWFFFLAFCLLAMWYFMTRRKERKERKEKKEKKEESDVKRHDEHLRVKENIVKGPKGAEAIAISIEKDEYFEKDKSKKEEESKEQNMCWKNGGIAAGVDLEKGTASASN